MSKAPDILVVDDEESIRSIVRQFAELKEFQVIEAGGGLSALEQLKLKAPPLVICDISMGGMSGLQVLEHIREQGLPCAVVMLTAHSESARIIEALRLGALDYVTKPFDAEVLMDKMDSWVEFGRRLKEMRDPSNRSTDVASQLRMIELFQLKAKKKVS